MNNKCIGECKPINRDKTIDIYKKIHIILISSQMPKSMYNEKVDYLIEYVKFHKL